MAGGVTVSISIPPVDKFPPLLRLSQGVQRPDVRKVMGRAIGNRLRKHFTQLDRERANQLGGKRTHFYGQARRAVQQPELVGGDGLKVSINHVGIAQRYFGGEIRPKSTNWLTLPIHPDAYGHRAREFSDLVFIPGEDGRRAWLARPNEESPNGIGEFFYLLVRRVRQEPDPDVLPPEEDLQQEALAAGEDHMSTLIARSQGN